MRILTSQQQDNIERAHGARPTLVVIVEWIKGGQQFYYFENRFLSGQDVAGKILSIDPIDAVIDVNTSSYSTSCSVVLDDVDGTIKDILSYVDPHGVDVWIYQWFADRPLEEYFLLFKGQIASPIIWSEGEKKFSFSIVSKLEDKNVGFELEEANAASAATIALAQVPEDLIGVSWPIIFGTIQRLELIPFVKVESIHTTTPIYFSDPSIPVSISLKKAKVLILQGYALFWYITAGALKFQGLPEAADDAKSRGDAINQTVSDLNTEIDDLEETFKDQESKITTSVRLAPSGVFKNGQTTIIIGDFAFAGTVTGGNTFNFKYPKHPDFVKDNFIVPVTDTKDIDYYIIQRGGAKPVYKKTVKQYNFYSQQVGAQVRIKDQIISFIVACNAVTNIVLEAYKNVNNTRTLVKVPNDAAIQSFIFTPASGIALRIIKMKALTCRLPDEGYEDGIFISCTATNPPNNPASIIAWAVNTFSNNLVVDNTTLTETYTATLPLVCNGVLKEKMALLDFVKEVAFQGKIGVWISDGIIYMKYLPAEPSSVDTITESDILQETMELGTTQTENIITRFRGTYRKYQNQEKDSVVIVSANVGKYGIKQRDYNFFLYSSPKIIRNVEAFWLTRLSNTFKILKFKTPIHKLALELYDCVTLDFNTKYVSNNDIKSIVQKITYDSDAKTLDFEVFVPVLMGQMAEYAYAWPQNNEIPYDTFERAAAGEIGDASPAAILDTTPVVNALNSTQITKFILNFSDRGPAKLSDATIQADAIVIDTTELNTVTVPTYNYDVNRPVSVTVNDILILDLERTPVYDPKTGRYSKMSTFFTVTPGHNLALYTKRAAFSDGTKRGLFGFRYDDTAQVWRPSVSFLGDC